MVGGGVTLADIMLFAYVSEIVHCMPRAQHQSYSNLIRWFDFMQHILPLPPGLEIAALRPQVHLNPTPAVLQAEAAKPAAKAAVDAAAAAPAANAAAGAPAGAAAPAATPATSATG